jgi:hypothetical protein
MVSTNHLLIRIRRRMDNLTERILRFLFLSSGGYSNVECSGAVPLDRRILFFCTGIRQRTLVRAPNRSWMDMCSLVGLCPVDLRGVVWCDCTVQNKGDFRKGVVAVVKVLRPLASVM